jgi:CMP-N-acetylneuraminic acid synthetase
MTADNRLRPAIAVIPARGGSKRLPRKNVLPFFGHPIIAHTIRAALQARCFDRVVVSTEDEEIAEVSRRYGADIDARPAELADDRAGVVDVCVELLTRDAAVGRTYAALCALYATAPLRGADDIRATMALLEPGRCEFALAVTEYDLPPYRALRRTDNGSLVPMWPELAFAKSQDVPQLVVNNASTYAVSVPAFLKHRTFTGPGARGHVMPRGRSTDIDVAQDLEEARHKASILGWREAGLTS